MEKMKRLIYVTGFLTLMISCTLKLNQEKNLNYKETQVSFFDLAHGDWTTNKWIRIPANLKMVNETFKCIGYLNLIPCEFMKSNDFFIRDICINKNFYDLFDSLEITYSLDTIHSKYYREFWNRRRKEENESIIYEIVKDVNLIKKQKIIMYDPYFVNDTLYDLLQIQFRYDTLTNDLAKEDFDVLKKYGLHESAYNLLYERYDYYDINWNRDSLVETLDTVTNYVGAWFEDNTK